MMEVQEHHVVMQLLIVLSQEQILVQLQVLLLEVFQIGLTVVQATHGMVEMMDKLNVKQ